MTVEAAVSSARIQDLQTARLPLRLRHFPKRTVTRFFQDFLYFTEAPMRSIAAFSSA